MVIERSVNPLGEFSQFTGPCAVFVRSDIHFSGFPCKTRFTSRIVAYQPHAYRHRAFSYLFMKFSALAAS